jgi:hypothetical protein
VTTRINVQEAKRLIPRLLDRPLVGGPIVVEDQGQPRLVVLDGQEYTRYVAWRRRDAVRAFILAEMDRRQTEPWWDQGFEALEALRQKAQHLTPLEVEALIDEAIGAVRQER